MGARSSKRDDDVLVVQRVMSGSPPEVLHCILSHLSVADVCRVSSVCSTWNELSNDNHLWKTLFLRDRLCFPDVTYLQEQIEQGCDYKSVYKHYSLTLKRWMTGRGVSLVKNTLMTPNGEVCKCECLAVCSHYILTRPFRKSDHDINVFSGISGEYSHQLGGLDGQAGSVITSKDETLVAANSQKGNLVCVWQIETGECMHSLEQPGEVCTIAMNETMLVTGICGEEPSVLVWSIATGLMVHELHCIQPQKLVMDCQHIVVHNDSADVLQMWDVNTGMHCKTWMGEQYSKILLDSHTHSLVALVGSGMFVISDCVRIWDTETNVCRGAVTAPDEYQYTDIIIHEGTVVIACDYTGSNEATFAVVDLKAAVPELLMMQLVSAISDITGLCHNRLYRVSNRLIAMVSRRSNTICCISLWDMQQSRFVRRMRLSSYEGITAINLSFNKLQLVVQDQGLHTYDFGSI